MRLPPLAIGAGAGLLAAALLAPAAGTALNRLAGERGARAQSAAERSAPPAAALVAPDLAIRAPDEASARAAILARVQRLARTGGVLVEETAPVRRTPLAALRLRVSGPEKSVIALADALERERPLMRLRSWRLEPVAGGVRLTAEVIAPWQ